MKQQNFLGSLFGHIGYGPLIVPPLIITTVFCFSFIMMESKVVAPQPSSTAASSNSQPAHPRAQHGLPALPYQTANNLQVLDTNVTSSGVASSLNNASPQANATQTEQIQGTSNGLGDDKLTTTPSASGNSSLSNTLLNKAKKKAAKIKSSKKD